MEMGKAWREARETGRDVADTIADMGTGFDAFRGTVSDYDWETRDGFTFGNVSIDGTGEHKGNDYRIWLKNENMVGWLNDEVHATILDLVCLIDTENGEPVTNPNCRQGQAIIVAVLPAPNPFATRKRLASFGPRRAGLDQAYRPAAA